MVFVVGVAHHRLQAQSRFADTLAAAVVAVAVVAAAAAAVMAAASAVVVAVAAVAAAGVVAMADWVVWMRLTHRPAAGSLLPRSETRVWDMAECVKVGRSRHHPIALCVFV